MKTKKKVRSAQGAKSLTRKIRIRHRPNRLDAIGAKKTAPVSM
jgi:hypothetical protein